MNVLFLSHRFTITIKVARLRSRLAISVEVVIILIIINDESISILISYAVIIGSMFYQKTKGSFKKVFDVSNKSMRVFLK